MLSTFKNNALKIGLSLFEPIDKILDIENCYLQKDPSNAIRLSIKDYALKNGLTFYNVRSWQGLLRNIIIRTSTTGDLMVIVIFKENDEEKVNGLLNHLKVSFPEITSLMFVINDKKNDLSH